MNVNGRWTAIPVQPAAQAKLNREWERALKLAASRHAPPTPLDEPLEVELHFMLPRPAKPRFDVPASRPDRDKLERFVMDALEGIIWKNDGRVVAGPVTKQYGRPGCRIIVRTLETRQGGLFDEQDSEVCVLRDRVQQGPADEA